MPSARRFGVVLFASLWILSACVGVAPSEQTNAPVVPTTGAGAAATAAPASQQPTAVAEAPTQEPPSDTPITEPTENPAPPPPRTQAPEPAKKPNLVISKFSVDEDPVLVGTSATLTATVKNTGSGDAGPFYAEIDLTADGQPDTVFQSKSVEGGLAAGETADVTVSINPTEAAEMRFVARADVGDQISEANESDNEKALKIAVQGIGNLNVPYDGLAVTADPQVPGSYNFQFVLTNTGISAVVGRMGVKFFGYSAAGNYVEWGTVGYDVNIAPDGVYSRPTAFNVDPGSYRAYALIDPDNTIPETDEDDNEASIDFTAP
jgi:hypothetical protein